MEPKTLIESSGRRTFMQSLACGGLALAMPRAVRSTPASKPLNGLFPIGSTPFTESDKLDLDCLAEQVKFVNRGGVHGLVWPQIASGWSTLSEDERLAGAEAILAAGKGGRGALVIGVQAKDGSVEQAIKYVKHAQQHGADAIISLPPKAADENALLEYYKQIGAANDLPLFVQSTGNFSVDAIVAMYKAVPTMRVVKDEAGNPLERVTALREKTGDKLAIFSGNGVRTMITEMELGFTGHCPTVGLSDVYQAAWDLWRQGKHNEAFDMFGRVLAFGSIPGSAAYVLVARGVFKETTKSRPTPGMESAGSGGSRGPQHLDENGKRMIREALGTYLKPYLRA
jgi:dihydrodipicolinate synthase/N-acetylneuraminate lyase